MKLQRPRFLLSLAGVSMLMVSAVEARASVTLFDSGGFESTAGYVPGNLGGQPSSASANEQWLDESAATHGTISTQVVSSGAGQVVQMVAPYERIGKYLGFGGYADLYPATYASGSPYQPSLTPGGATSNIIVSWTESYGAYTNGIDYNSNPSGNPTYPDTFFGIQVYNGSTSTGGFGIDTKTGQLAEFSESLSTPMFTNLPTSVIQFSPNTTYAFSMDLNYPGHVVSIYVNGQLIASQEFSNIGTQNNPAYDTEFTDADLVGQNEDYGVFAETVTFDNYSVIATAAVPEPASFALAAIMVPMLLSYRPRRHA